MRRDEIHQEIPRLLRRLFTWGVAASVLFLLIWYHGGQIIWGHYMDLVLNVLAFPMDLTFDAQAQGFAYTVEWGLGLQNELFFPTNLFNLSLVELVMLLAVWPHANRKQAFQLIAWSLLFITLYHAFNTVVQLQTIRWGPELAARHGMMWESSWTYAVLHKVAAFDKFILRYWGGFPVFGLALLAQAWVQSRSSSNRPKSEPAQKKSKRRKSR